MSAPSKSDMKAAIKEVQRQLKSHGIKLKDSSRQAADALEVLQKFPYLRPSVGMMSGSEQKFFKLEGTVQMFFNSNGYYVPLAVFLRETHPDSPPVCMIQPTPDMMIKPHHFHVDAHGLVYLPYLHDWTKRSSIVEMLREVSAIFTSDPFIFKKPSQPPATPSYLKDNANKGATKSKPVYEQESCSCSQIPNLNNCCQQTAGGKQTVQSPPHRTPPQPPVARNTPDVNQIQKTMRALDLKGPDLTNEVKAKAKEMDELDSVLENSFRCPISMEIMSDPVFAADGHTYERVEIERWLQTRDTSPLTNEKLPHKMLTPNHNLRSQILEYQQKNAIH
ncbi:vacuolar sorting protein 23A [Guillardia theta CCMP2712]|uniref:Vacuolar sorting protein 23A n=1 Tax=Guillardia theta (strain CCMP2712) TaxID=905079 RepID=L1JUG5_GUITC|nr:vacuolar sorting protein 23A [Guillardia theta CCMP2712]EKX51733.1 vacuolar sorting protein 23A [Guillardia theta CCMP2712]|eukprot:XP_005838713.1 vacuolar sorting protein 23A [Guillardia theta CCMP2712]